MDYPASIQRLIQQIARLPGIGKRSAERIALHLMRSGPEISQQLAQAILDAKEKIRHCSRCGGYTELNPCAICQDPRRDTGMLCVVEGPNDILNLERTSQYRGLYHALMGRISPLNGIGPEQLRIAALRQRVRSERFREVILALGADAESEATANYLASELESTGVLITRIAQGLPAGAALEAADEVTLSRALSGRQKITPGSVKPRGESQPK